MMPTRVRLSRKKGARKPAGAIVVGRPTRWGNTFPVGYPSPFTREEAVNLYRELIVNRSTEWTDGEATAFETTHHFTAKPDTPTVEEIREQLAGRDLA